MEAKTMSPLRYALLFGLAGTVNTAQAGWFDWFTPGEWVSSMGNLFASDDEKARGFYLGGGAGVVRADWGIQRRVGGANDPTSPSIKYQNEPALLTVANLRFGWQPFSWLEAEAEWNFDLEKDQISENPQRSAELQSLSGIYLRPQLHWGNAQFYLEVGYNQLNVAASCGGNDDIPINDNDDQTFVDSCRSFDVDGLAYGAGVGLHVSEQSKLTFSWRQLYKGDDFINGNSVDTKASAVMIGVTVGFGGGDGEDDYY